VAWHPNGRELAIGHGEWGLHLWDVEHPGRVPIELQSGDLPTASQVLWNRAGTRLAIVDRLLNTSGLLIWDVSHSQQELASTPNTDDVIGHLEFLADDQSLLAVADRSGVVSRWGPDASGSGPYTERVLTTLPSVGAAAYDLMGNVVNAPLARSADGRWLAGGGLEGRIRLWAWTPQGPPAQVGEPRLLPSTGAPLAQLAWSPDGRALAATEVLRADADRCDQTGRVFRWDVAAGTTPRVVWAGTPPANAVAWNPEGTLLAVAVCDGTVHVWDDQQGRVVHVLRP
jgi:WD40 repeat protein